MNLGKKCQSLIILNVKLIKEEVENDVNERLKKQNNGLSTSNGQYEQGKSNIDTESTRYRGTSEGISTIPTNKQETTNNKGLNKESIGSSRKELENSSFSNNIVLKKYPYNSNILYKGGSYEKENNF